MNVFGAEGVGDGFWHHKGDFVVQEYLQNHGIVQDAHNVQEFRGVKRKVKRDLHSKVEQIGG